ncbi:thioredoxin reductase [Curtobacterium sp. MCPF17_011]|uniref:NAD(P)/FAD-dependent oxidoreductase n=1 Tax=Curtobacterium sp. MCPF17_011 TaxID=2175652 RepID=UPI000DAA0746|nr:NAD(P)/FAD-dependent oxidoreductase [Curtobacterium sp. MCPF17_011]PZF12025.1 thioredoxin reductase [Curtobacterium sp. MCPF17_011]
MSEHFDVIVVGGGPAGLSAALILGRSRRSVLVVDAGEPRNAPAEGVHNLLGQEGTAPRDLVRIGRQEVARYGVTVTDGRVVAASATPVTDDDPLGFRLTLDSGEVVTARRVVVAGGAVDVLPDVPGLAEQWGRGVVHCPFCHGWEVRDRRIGVLVTTAAGAHQVQMFRALSDDVTAFVTDPDLLDDTVLAGFAARGIRVVRTPVVRVLSEGDALSGVELADGTVVELDALAAASRVEARVEWAAGLGLTPVDQEANGVLFGRVLAVDGAGQTEVPGVFAAGNAANAMLTVVASAAAGSQTGAMVHGDLLRADVAAAISAGTGTGTAR